MSKILITGGSGFIGTNLVSACLKRGDSVLNVDVKKPQDERQQGSWAKLDVRDKDGLLATVADFRPEYVVHLAARTDLDGKSLAAYDTNVLGVENLIYALRQYPPRKALFASSMFVCRLGYIPSNFEDYCPHTVYGKSKVEGERIVRKEAADFFPWILFRPTSIWGPWFDVPYKGFFSAVKRGLYFHPAGASILRSYGFVLNTVEQILALMSADDALFHRRSFYISDFTPTNIKNWAELISRAFGHGRVRELPFSVLKLGAVCGDALKATGMKNPPLTSFRLSNLLTPAVFDLSELREICGPSSYSLEDGVSLTVEWMQTGLVPHVVGAAQRSCAK